MYQMKNESFVLKEFNNLRFVANRTHSILGSKRPIYYATLEQNITDSLGNGSWRQVTLDYDIVQELAQPYFDTGLKPVEKE
jgi:hypothetical protein